jgi:hypothetical protein
MKTGVSSLTNLIFSLSFSLVISSCNKEDFYQKQYLDNPFQNDPTSTTGSADNGSQGGASGGGNGGTQGGVDSGTNGGTNGSTTGSTTSGGNSNGGVDGSATSGTDGGSTTSGSTTGGSTTGGSTTSGSTTGGSTTSGSTTSGSTTGGSTTGGSTTGGSTTGGMVDCSIPNSSSLCAVETFNQSANATKKLDIVWIIDNSGSMADEQDALGTNFSAFIDEFITKDVDFKMAITTTDVSSSYKKGRMVNGSDLKLTSAMAKQNENRFKDDFMNLVRVGTNGSGNEKGLEASEGFMQKYASSFLRQDAYLAVVILSDEEDQSPNLVSDYTNYLKSFKSEAGLVKFYTIADINKTSAKSSGITVGAERYKLASNQTAGVIANIRDDFYQSLTSMGDSILNLLDSFALGFEPVSGSLKVYVNGVLSSDYTYDASSRSIKFDPNHLPTVGSVIKVYYLKK